MFSIHSHPYMKSLAITAASVFMLSACSTVPSQSQMNVQAGQTFTLNKAITIQPDTARTFIQYGKVTTQNGYERYDQHCRIEIRELKDATQTIQPQTFSIEKVRLDIEQVAQSAMPATHYAKHDIKPAQPSDWYTVSMGGGSDQAPPETMDIVHFYLSSNTQPNIFRLTCAGSLSLGNPFDSPRSHRPQKAEVNKILGRIGQL